MQQTIEILEIGLKQKENYFLIFLKTFVLISLFTTTKVKMSRKAKLQKFIVLSCSHRFGSQLNFYFLLSSCVEPLDTYLVIL